MTQRYMAQIRISSRINSLIRFAIWGSSDENLCSSAEFSNVVPNEIVVHHSTSEATALVNLLASNRLYSLEVLLIAKNKELGESVGWDSDQYFKRHTLKNFK